MASCKKHGETEFLPPDANGNSYCRECVQEWLEKYTGVVKHKDKPAVSMGCRVEQTLCSRRSTGFPELDEALRDGVPKEALTKFFGAGRRRSYIDIMRDVFPIQPMPESKGPIFMKLDCEQKPGDPKITVTHGQLEALDGSATFELGEDKEGHFNITCRLCKMTSYSADDIGKFYCGNCHAYHTGSERISR